MIELFYLLIGAFHGSLTKLYMKSTLCNVLWWVPIGFLLMYCHEKYGGLAVFAAVMSYGYFSGRKSYSLPVIYVIFVGLTSYLYYFLGH